MTYSQFASIGRIPARIVAALALALSLGGCPGDPTTRVDVVDDRPQLVVANPSDSAKLVVNGIDVGLAKEYAGKPGTLRLAEGTHEVEVRESGRTVHRETVFLTDETIRTIRIAP